MQPAAAVCSALRLRVRGFHSICLRHEDGAVASMRLCWHAQMNVHSNDVVHLRTVAHASAVGVGVGAWLRWRSAPAGMHSSRTTMRD